MRKWTVFALLVFGLLTLLYLAMQAKGQTAPAPTGFFGAIGNSCNGVAVCSVTLQGTPIGTNFVGVFVANATAVTKLTDNHNGVYSLLSGPTTWSSGFVERFYAGPNPTGGPVTITLTLAGNVYSELHLYSYSTLGAFDTSAPAITGKGTNATSGQLSPSMVGDVMISYFHSDGGATQTAGGGWTGRVETGATYPLLQDMIGMSIQNPYVATMSFNQTANYVAFFIAYKPSNNPPAPPVSGPVSISTVGGTLTIVGTRNGVSQSSIFDSGPNIPLTFSFAGVVHSVVLSWAPSSSGSVVTGYSIFRSQTSGIYSNTALASTSTITYTDSTVVAGQNYFYVVQAVAPACTVPPPTTPCGNSANSNEVAVSIPSP